MPYPHPIPQKRIIPIRFEPYQRIQTTKPANNQRAVCVYFDFEMKVALLLSVHYIKRKKHIGQKMVFVLGNNIK